MIAALWVRVAPYVIAAGVIGLAVVLVLLRVFGAGKTAAKAEAAMTSLQRVREANEARAWGARAVSPKEETDDPFNRDPRSPQ